MNLIKMTYKQKNTPALRILLIIFLLFSSQLFAKPISIAVVNIKKVMTEAPQAGRSSINLKAKFLPMEEKLAEQATEIKQLEEKIKQLEEKNAGESFSSEEKIKQLEAKNAGESFFPEKKLKLNRKLRALKRTYDRALEDFREEFRFARDRELDKVQNEVYEAIHVVRAKLGIDLIVQQYVSANPRIDITNNVLEYLDKKMQQEQLNRNTTKSNNDSLNPQ